MSCDKDITYLLLLFATIRTPTRTPTHPHFARCGHVFHEACVTCHLQQHRASACCNCRLGSATTHYSGQHSGHRSAPLASPLTPAPGAGSPGSWLRDARGTSREVTQSPTEGVDAACVARTKSPTLRRAPPRCVPHLPSRLCRRHRVVAPRAVACRAAGAAAQPHSMRPLRHGRAALGE